MIQAFETLDCASKVRVHYLLPAPLELSLLRGFGDAELAVQEFSRFAAGAKDHLTLTAPGYRAAGVLGEARLVVTFGKPGGVRPVETVSAFESVLAKAFAAPVRYGERAQLSEEPR